MMSHFITCKVRCAKCKTCETAFMSYAEAKTEYDLLDNYVLEIAINQGYAK